MRKYIFFAVTVWVTITLLVFASRAIRATPSAQSEPAPQLQPSAATVLNPNSSSPAAINPAHSTVSPPKTFVETFDESPAHPTAWQPANWDVTIHSRDTSTWGELEPMHAMHGSDCGAPPAAHDISAYEETVFQCRDHLMTAIKADGYGVIYLTPNQLVDFTSQEAVISWDLSTLRTSGRDWIDVWVTPYQDNLQLPLEDWLPDLSGPPRNAIHIRMDMANGDTMFRTSIIQDFHVSELPDQKLWVGYESFLKPDAKRRDTFDLQLSRTHIRFGMPNYNFNWIDSAIPELGWSAGIVQFGHHSYNPSKHDGCSINQAAAVDCAPNTWHWDNVSISPAVPFTLLRADQRVVDAEATKVRFSAPAPANAHLRFAGIGSQLEISCDDGKTWQPALHQAQEKSAEEHFGSYWMPVPAGTQSIQFRGSDWWGGSWMARDISIWALDPASSALLK